MYSFKYTTGFRDFAVFTPKPPRHTAKSLPKVADGEPPMAAMGTANA